ncbi:MAG: AAA family ATPase [Candidatus Thiodiazotropha sp. (ex Monitilora ramsayi)]|nr:AAA family ATPase [Candidatus Thiodiazotropha sp. (ex Monitilora ramsayi)]
MFHEYFGIAEDPFSITPDTRYLYLSERHRNAFAHLLYGVAEGGGFVQLTGEVGTGKTLLCRNLLAQLPKEVNIALIFNPRLTPLELVASICDELKILYPIGCTSIKEIVDFLNAFLLESHRQGRRTVVIIDEAQNLSYEALEQVRLLTNLETEKQKLMQIILVGQPELKSVLEQPQLRQLAQRITARYHLTPLSADETQEYVQHRLSVAGMNDQLFDSAALRTLFKLTGGVPRLVNVLSSRAMMAAYAADTKTISARLLKRVSSELAGVDTEQPTSHSWRWVAAAVLVLGLGLLFFQQGDGLRQWLGQTSSSAVSAETGTPSPERVTSVVKDTSAHTTTMAEEAVAKDPVPVELPVEAEKAAPAVVGTVTEADADAPVDVEEVSLTNADNVLPTGMKNNRTNTNSIDEEVLIGSRPTEVDEAISSMTQPDSESSLSLMGLLGNQNNAFATLFGYWQSVYPVGDETLSACERAERVDLSCIYGRGDWQNLEYYNRPAVIELLLDDGRRYHVVVSELDEHRVTLDLESRRLTFSRGEIEPLWTGSYIVLWRPPKLSNDSLSVGDWGRDVAWVISMLDRIEGVLTEYDPRRAKFDRDLKERVMRFQLSQGLVSDGIVGRKTVIMLSVAVSDSTTPVLHRSKS